MIGHRLFASEPIGNLFYLHAVIFEIPKQYFIIKPPACWDADVSIEIYELLLLFSIITPWLYCTENHVFFLKTSWKDCLSKKIVLDIIFLVLSRKMMFIFPENRILHLTRKMKDDLYQNLHGNMIFSSNFLKRWSFQKGPFWDMIFFVLSGKMVFFSRKHDIFSSGGKWEVIFFKKYMEIWNFLCTRTGVTNVVSRSSAKKNERWSYPAKIHPKVIDVLDWNPRKSSSYSLYFHGDYYRRFHVLLSSEKNSKPNI